MDSYSLFLLLTDELIHKSFILGAFDQLSEQLYLDIRNDIFELLPLT